MNTIEECISQIRECSVNAEKMRAVVINERLPTDLRYKAVIIEEAHLELITKLLKKIEELKETLYAPQTDVIYRNHPKDGH